MCLVTEIQQYYEICRTVKDLETSDVYIFLNVIEFINQQNNFKL